MMGGGTPLCLPAEQGGAVSPGDKNSARVTGQPLPEQLGDYDMWAEIIKELGEGGALLALVGLAILGLFAGIVAIIEACTAWMKGDYVGTNTVAVTSQALAKWHHSTDVQHIGHAAAVVGNHCAARGVNRVPRTVERLPEVAQRGAFDCGRDTGSPVGQVQSPADHGGLGVVHLGDPPRICCGRGSGADRSDLSLHPPDRCSVGMLLH